MRANMGVYVTIAIFALAQGGTGLWFASNISTRLENVEKVQTAQGQEIKDISDKENATAVAIEGLKRTQDAVQRDVKDLDGDIEDLDQSLDEMNKLLRQLLMGDRLPE